MPYNSSDLPTGDESRESHGAFIMLNWELAAAAAWQGYVKHGRGAIVIDVNRAKDPPPGMPYYFGTSQAAYVSQRMIKRQPGDWDWPDFERMVRQYDPNTEVVFMFLRTDGGSSGYRVGTAPGRPTPPRAFALHRGELGDMGQERAN